MTTIVHFDQNRTKAPRAFSQLPGRGHKKQDAYTKKTPSEPLSWEYATNGDRKPAARAGAPSALPMAPQRVTKKTPAQFMDELVRNKRGNLATTNKRPPRPSPNPQICWTAGANQLIVEMGVLIISGPILINSHLETSVLSIQFCYAPGTHIHTHHTTLHCINT